jgi:uncharacterized protein
MTRFVLDTNIIAASISDRSPHHWIWKQLTQERNFILCVTNDIVFEYAEVVSRFFGKMPALSMAETLKDLPNVEFVNVYFKWQLIENDPDDNKFVDCAIAANAKCIVSEDKHFRILKTIDFPKVEVLTIEEFKESLKK